MKLHADNHRKEVSFRIGDWVMVKLCPHCQLSAVGSSYSKLPKCFYGPFKIVEQIGNIAYKLELPEGSRIHPIFHYSILKPFH